MEKMARVQLRNNGGYKYFYGENAEAEANAFEVELRQQEIEKREKQRVEQEERKAKEEKEKTMITAIQDSIDLVNREVEKYEKETGELLSFVTMNGKLTVQKATKNLGRGYCWWDFV